MPFSPLAFFRTGPDQPQRPLDPPELRKVYESIRLRAFLAITIGYGFFYICRLSFSVAKKPMLDAGVLDAKQMGQIGSALLFAYAFGRFTNGFLADRSNIKRFMTLGLVVSAVLNLGFGLTSSFLLFVVLWGFNGWFQSMGSAPSAVVLSQWFSNRERGTRYGIWSLCNNIGEGLTFIGTTALISWLGWRWGFFGPGMICLLVAVIMYRSLADRPETYGLPPVAEYKHDLVEQRSAEVPVGTLQREVLFSGAIWVLGLSSALMYVARYAVNNWAVLYLQEAKGYSLTAAGSIVGVNTIVGMAGVVFSGWFSDRCFGSRRNLPCFLYALLEVAALVLFYLTPPGEPWLDTLAMGMFGFAIGGLMVYLGGLMAIDVSSKRATGAAMGVIGIFSYLGAAVQDWISGSLIQASKTMVDGVASYRFDQAFIFWISASIVSMLLPLTIWNVRHRD
ncbi:MAG: hypothetical protein A2284_14545 [Deltaproteobacteria bacterium RIFOXYA12_FULL_61_11]|nr:MAG: hypothetical protein A2284_14545 [Deltaproteobacteria bacterium RIFOXYA12_FULL_61_11]